MAQSFFYRYVSALESASITKEAMIRSRSGVTYFAMDPPSRYETIAEASERLAMPPKDIRVGPIPADELPAWDVVSPRTVSPVALPDGRWQPGGGTECATSHPTWIFGHLPLR